MYPGGRRGNNSRSHAKNDTGPAWQEVARFARHSLRGRSRDNFCAGARIVATATAWIHRGSVRLAKTTIYKELRDVLVCYTFDQCTVEIWAQELSFLKAREIFVLIAAFVFSSTALYDTFKLDDSRPLCMAGVGVALLLVSVSYLAGSDFNPFIYFRF